MLIYIQGYDKIDKRLQKDSKPFIFNHFETIRGICTKTGLIRSLKMYYKQNEVLNHLQRIGKVELPEFEPILGSEKQFFYRNKMEFSTFSTGACRRPLYWS